MKSRKYIILVFALLVVPAEMTAQNRIDKNQAVTVSTNFLRSIGLSTGQLLNIEEDYLNDTLCLYCVHYSNGNWTIVSASEYERPVLAYGNGTDMTLQYSDNPGFNALIWKYKRNILNADISVSRGLMPADSTTLRDIEERWQKLLYNAKGINSVEIKYNPGASLLNIPGRGDVKWGQTYNNENGCIPSYNRFCRGELFLNCNCDRTRAGCGPVALASVLSYYKYPEKPVGKGMLNLSGKQMEVNMKDAPFSWDGSKKAMAALMLCSAASVNSEIGATGTSSELIDFKPALMNNWGFSAKCSYLVKEPDMTMIQMVYVDLNPKRPVIIADAAHIFVIDG